MSKLEEFIRKSSIAVIYANDEIHIFHKDDPEKDTIKGEDPAKTWPESKQDSLLKGLKKSFLDTEFAPINPKMFSTFEQEACVSLKHLKNLPANEAIKTALNHIITDEKLDDYYATCRILAIGQICLPLFGANNGILSYEAVQKLEGIKNDMRKNLIEESANPSVLFTELMSETMSNIVRANFPKFYIGLPVDIATRELSHILDAEDQKKLATVIASCGRVESACNDEVDEDIDDEDFDDVEPEITKEWIDELNNLFIEFKLSYDALETPNITEATRVLAFEYKQYLKKCNLYNEDDKLDLYLFNLNQLVELRAFHQALQGLSECDPTPFSCQVKRQLDEFRKLHWSELVELGMAEGDWDMDKETLSKLPQRVAALGQTLTDEEQVKLGRAFVNYAIASDFRNPKLEKEILAEVNKVEEALKQRGPEPAYKQAVNEPSAVREVIAELDGKVKLLDLKMLSMAPDVFHMGEMAITSLMTMMSCRASREDLKHDLILFTDIISKYVKPKMATELQQIIKLVR